jgi:hypothetical protein
MTSGGSLRCSEGHNTCCECIGAMLAQPGSNFQLACQFSKQVLDGQRVNYEKCNHKYSEKDLMNIGVSYSYYIINPLLLIDIIDILLPFYYRAMNWQ